MGPTDLQEGEDGHVEVDGLVVRLVPLDELTAHQLRYEKRVHRQRDRLEVNSNTSSATSSLFI